MPRPISVCWSDTNEAKLCLVVEARGQATKWLIDQKSGAKLEISTPLGNGFKTIPGKRYLVIGGGIGIPPLYSVLREIEWCADSIICFTNKEKVIMEPNFWSEESDLIVATDDGSYGRKGRADEILRAYLSYTKHHYEAILACGPKPMLVAIAKIAKQFHIPCQVSLEERMACGIGDCKGCAVQLKTDAGTIMGTVCKDGPVFDSEEVVWNV